MYVLIAVFAVAVLVLLSASLHDIRSREIPDWHWVLLCIMALFCTFLRYNPLPAAVISSSYVLMILFLFVERVKGVIAVAVLAGSAVLTLVSYELTKELSMWVTLLMLIFILALYLTGLIRGGADAKAMVAISMLFPVYPDVGCVLWEPEYPIAYIFNPAFSTLIVGLLLSLLMAFYVLCRNLRCGRVSVTSFYMRIEEARGYYVWPLEDVSDGRKVKVRTQDDMDSIYDRLESAGFEDVLVTPMIPFIMPMTAAFILVMILGFPLAA